ncbi:MAG: hypothetical protein KAY24_03065 [Candidatus Eisenbacteria sp.]|nr:hypothetical protein [Candidatus Eisenbacteria bacterium]
MTPRSKSMPPAGSAARLLPAVLACAIALSTAGCFTMLRHPVVQSSPASDSSGTCQDCHSGYGAMDMLGFSWIDYYSASSYPWINYYGSPWWYESRWQPYRPEAHDQDECVATPLRVLGRWGWGHGNRISADGADNSARRQERAPHLRLPAVAPRLPATAARPPRATEEESQSADEKGEDGQREKNQKDPKKEKPQPRVLRR